MQVILNNSENNALTARDAFTKIKISDFPLHERLLHCKVSVQILRFI